MGRPTIFLAITTVSLISTNGIVTAQPPRVTDLQPSGIQRGVPTLVTIRGERLDETPRLYGAFDFETAAGSEEDQVETDRWNVTITVDPKTPVGTYPIRVQTESGLSNPLLIAVDQFKQVLEVEENGRPETAQEVTTPVVIDGRSADNDVDFFRFRGTKGQQILVDARCARIGSGLDPTLRLTTLDGRFVDANDDTAGLNTDARLIATLPEEGEYLVEISDSRYQGQNRPAYRLVIGDVPVATELFPLGGRRGQTIGVELRGGTVSGVAPAGVILESESLQKTSFARIPGGLIADRYQPFDVELPGPFTLGEFPELVEPPDLEGPPLRVLPPSMINGRLNAPGDLDRYQVVVQPGKKYAVQVVAATVGSGVDGLLRVVKPDGSQLARGDDAPIEIENKGQKNARKLTSADPSLTFDVPDGVTEVTLEFRDLSNRGGNGYPYRIRVNEVRPDFAVELKSSEVSIPRGGTANLPVHLARYGFNDPIELTAIGLPEGLMIREGRIPAGQTAGVISILADEDAECEPLQIKVVGRAKGSDRSMVRVGSKFTTFATLDGFPTNLAEQEGILMATARPSPISLMTSDEPITIPHGYGATVPVNVRRAGEQKTALKIQPLPMPGGLSAPESTIEESSDEGSVTINAGLNAPLGITTVAFTAQGNIDDLDRRFAVPAVKVEVVRPASLATDRAEVTLAVGSSATVAGTLNRTPQLKEAVSIMIEGLPDGVSSEPLTLGRDETSFELTLTGGDSVQPGEAQLSVKASFKIADKDYPPLTAPLKLTTTP